MKRQSSLVSQSSRRELNSPDPKLHAKSIGCMSGILHFLSKYQSRRKKLITLGKCDQGATQANEDALVTTNSSSKFHPEGKAINDNQLRIRSSLEVIPRSPTIPADVRCRSAESPWKPPEAVLLARLMGLEGMPKTLSKSDQMPLDDQTTADKRRKLLGALEKCDQDLKALKKIIEAVRSVESLQSSPMPGITPEISQKLVEDKASPVSVLDDRHLISREHLSDVINNGIYSRRHAHYGRVQTHVQRSQQEVCMMKKKKIPIRDQDDLFNPNMVERTVRSSHDDQHSSSLSSYDDYHQMWSMSKMAMMESVNEVCRDIAWGEKREIGRIGLALHDHICRDLVEDIVKELLFHMAALNGCFSSTSSTSSSSYSSTSSSSSSYDCTSIPFEACRRRLTF